MSKRMKQLSWSHPAFTVVEVSLLLVLTLCILGQWSLVFMLTGMSIFLSMIALIFSLMSQLSRNVGSDVYHHPFSCMLYSLVDPHEEHQEEEFKPFVFKDHPEENGHE